MFGLLGGLALGAMNMLSNQSSISAQQTAQANANAQNERQFQQSFAESQRQYNQNYNTAIQQYNQTFNENVRQYNQNYKFSQSQLAFERQQQAYQEALNRNRIQWAVKDAQKAGLHPMAALGLGAGSFSPISTSSVGAVPVSPGSLPGNAGLPNAGTYESVGGGPDWVADMGQNLAYAAAKAKDRKEQEEALTYLKELQGEQLKSAKLDNELKAAQVLSQLQQLRNSGPSNASVNGGKNLLEGQADSPYLDKPLVSNAFRLDEKGRKVDIVPSEALKGRTEDVLGVEWMPFVDSAKLNYMAKVQGKPFAGHWWHEKRGEFLPYPPKEKKSARQDNKDSYYHNSWRYR